MFILANYGHDYRQHVRIGDTLRMLARYPEDGTWSCTVSILTALGATPTDTQVLSAYTGNRVQGRKWDLSADYDTSGLTANTTYIASAQLTNGSKTVETNQSFRVLPQGA